MWGACAKFLRLILYVQNLGRLGPKGFQSRSMQSFQEALERGEVSTKDCILHTSWVTFAFSLDCCKNKYLTIDCIASSL